jgi:hypothetical protein
MYLGHPNGNQGDRRTAMIHVNVWSQEIESGVSVSYKGCRNAPRYCHELEIQFGTGNAVSLWGRDLQSIRDTLALALAKVDEQIQQSSGTSHEQAHTVTLKYPHL